MNARFAKLTLGVVAASSVGCAGARFDVSPSLRAAESAPVQGERPMCRSRGDGLLQTAMESATSDARFTAGPLSLLMAKPELEQREKRPAPTHFLTVLIDLEQKLGSVTEAGQSLRGTTAKVASAVPAASGVDQRVGATVTALSDVQEALAALRAWLTMPFEVSEVATMSLVAVRGDDHVYVVCRSTNTLSPGATYRPSDFRLNCHLVSNRPGAPAFDLSLHAEGSSWVDYVFNGSLTSHEGRGWSVGSQSMRAMGAGTVRGFELRRSDRQEAAVSFFEDATWVSETSTTRYSPRAWWLAQPSTNDELMLQATLVVLTALPLPSTCDASAMSQRATPEALQQ